MEYQKSFGDLFVEFVVLGASMSFWLVVVSLVIFFIAATTFLVLVALPKEKTLKVRRKIVHTFFEYQ